jgi:hypothetical protein
MQRSRIAAFGRRERCIEFFRRDVQQTSGEKCSLQECMPDSTASLIQPATTNPRLHNSPQLVSAYKVLFLCNSSDNMAVSPHIHRAESPVGKLALSVPAF